jgi:ABC-type multidrug transport system permease subunit
MDIKLALRLRVVIFFNYLFPLIFFFGFAVLMHRNVEQMVFVENMSVTLGVLGSGFFGAGIRAIQERELNILRRYKVTPITPAPIMVGSMVTGWFLFMPYIIAVVLFPHADS